MTRPQPSLCPWHWLLNLLAWLKRLVTPPTANHHQGGDPSRCPFPGVAAMFGNKKAGRQPSPVTQYFANPDANPLTDSFDQRHMRQHLGGCAHSIDAGQARANWESWVHEAANDHSPVALYLHTPFCHHRCSFCPFYINRHSPGYSRDYSDLLLKEIELSAAGHLNTRPLNSIFFGGGTPSDLDTGDLVRVLQQLRQYWPWDANTEVTVEARVRGFTTEKAQAWMDAGVNRFSLGVQSTDTKLRQSLGRLANREELLRTLQDAANLPNARISVDLLYGLPGQTVTMLQEDIRLLTGETTIGGITFYELVCFPNSPMIKAIEQGRLPRLPDKAELADLFLAGRAALNQSGFQRHSLVHWRRNDREVNAYNHHVKSGADIMPLGSGAGGCINGQQIMLSRNLAEYRTLIANAQKPIAHAARLSPQRHQLQGKITSGFEHMRLSPDAFKVLGEQGYRYINEILGQWRQCDLLDANHHLTPTGELWAKTMERQLLAASCQFQPQTKNPRQCR